MYIIDEVCQVMTHIKNFFYTHPVFRYETFSEFMTGQGIESSSSWRKMLQYHIQTGNIVLIRRGLYGVLNPMTDSKTNFYIDPFLVAGQVVENSILAYHTALELHGIAYTTFEILTFLTQKQVRPFSFQSQKYQAIHPPGILLKKSKENFLVETIIRSGLEIKVTGLERTIVDIIDRPNISGGWEEIWRSLENLVILDLDKLIDYSILLDNTSTIAKVGFILDTLTTIHSIDKKKLNRLLKYIPKQPCYFERSKRKEGSLIKKWNLIVPDKILNQTWKENYETAI